MNSRYTRALTPREQEVIELLSTGLTNEEIARQLDISLDGVKYHVSGILRRLRVENRREAASLHLGTEGGVLTPRELEVIELLSTGLTNEEIAGQLGISLDGVKYHVSGILRRLDVGSRREAASLHLRTEGSGRFAAWAPVMFLRKLPFASPRRVFDWLPHAAAGAVLTAAAAGIALLAWGVMSTSSDSVTTTGCTSVEQTGDSAPPCAPGVAQSGAEAISAISAGGSHTCALKGGGVSCWGDEYGGGLSGTGGSTIAIAVSGLTSSVSAISAGDTYTCALKDGGVWCWDTQLADNSPNQATPATGRLSSNAALPVSGLERGVSAISGDWPPSACAIKDGGVWCWGGTGSDGDIVTNLVPLAVAGLATGVSAISAGKDHTCALKDGGVWCWGIDPNLCPQNGPCGALPVAVSGLASSVSAISGGCALKDGGVWCWGFNNHGQLGNNSPTYSPVPVAVQFPP